MATARLSGEGIVAVEGIGIEVPGVIGTVSVRPGGEPAGVRSTRRGGPRRDMPPSTPLDEALSRNAMATQRTLSISGRRPRPVRRRGGGAAAPKAEPALLTVPAPEPGMAQVVLKLERGGATWHLSREPQPAEAAPERRARTRREVGEAAPPSPLTYELPLLSPLPGTAVRRGGFPVEAVVKVFTFPVSHAVGDIARFAARSWDTDRHKPSVRMYEADGTLRALDERDWERLAAGRALLFVHGTFSTTDGAFGTLAPDVRRRLHETYEGRVIAFDHPTIADDPFVNARQFYEIVGDHALDLDIVCHSRGGLVARSIAERPGFLADLGVHVRVSQVVHVAVVNAGTILADTDHWVELLDRFTTLFGFVPAPGAVETLETVLAVVKSIALETAHDLEGLSAMAPGSTFLGKLNAAGTGRGDMLYRAITSNFEPHDPDMKAWLHDEIRDAIFGGRPNDMMVTIESMAGENGSDRFPIAEAERETFEPAEAIEHSMYFGQPKTARILEQWLTAGRVAVPA